MQHASIVSENEVKANAHAKRDMAASQRCISIKPLSKILKYNQSQLAHQHINSLAH